MTDHVNVQKSEFQYAEAQVQAPARNINGTIEIVVGVQMRGTNNLRNSTLEPPIYNAEWSSHISFHWDDFEANPKRLKDD